MTRVIMVEAYARLPEFIQARIAPLRPRHSIEASFAAVMPIEKRLALKAQYPHIRRGGRPFGMAPEPRLRGWI